MILLSQKFWNSSLTLRAVLIIDVWHPDLTAAESWALERIMKLSPVERKYARTVLKTQVGLRLRAVIVEVDARC